MQRKTIKISVLEYTNTFYSNSPHFVNGMQDSLKAQCVTFHSDLLARRGVKIQKYVLSDFKTYIKNFC